MHIVQARAEERRAMAVAGEQEMRACVVGALYDILILSRTKIYVQHGEKERK